MRTPIQWLRGDADPADLQVAQKATTPDGYPAVTFPPEWRAMLALYGTGGSYASIYAKQPNVRAVIDTVAREGAGLTLKMYEKVPRSERLPSGRLPADDHGMAELLAEPTPGQSTFRFWYATFADIEVYDLAIWQKVRVRGQRRPSALVRVPPQNLLPERDPYTGQIIRWRNLRGQEVPAEDIMVFWGYDPGSMDSSISPMETIRRQMADEWQAMAARGGMWRNSLRKDGVIEQELETTAMSDDARESFMIDVEDSLTGAANEGRPLMLLPGQHWKDTQWSPRDMEYLEARKLSRRETAAAFHIPPRMVAAGDGEIDEATLKVFYQSSMPPRLQRIERDIEAQLLPDFEPVLATRRTFYVEFNLDAKLRGSFEDQAAIMATTAGGPIITVNEARSRINLPPIPGGDLIFVPLNSARAGGPQGSPQAPVATPGGGIEPAGTTPGGGTQPQPSASAEDAKNGEVIVLGAEAAQKALSADPDEAGSVLEQHDATMAARKAAEDHNAFLRATRLRFEERHARTLEKFFARQRNAAEGGKPVDTERWNEELADELYGVAFQTASMFGEDAAKRMGGGWSPERTESYLRSGVTTRAAQINQETARLLTEADEPNLDAVFGDGRVAQLSTTATTWTMNWSIQEAAHQNGEA